MPAHGLKSRPDPAGEVEGALQEMRRAVAEFSRRLGALGAWRPGAVADEAEDLADEGRRALRDVEVRLSRLETALERSLREHPGAWAGSALALLGLGLVVVLMMRRGR